MFVGSVYKDSNDEFRFRITSKENGQTVAGSEEGFKNHQHATEMCNKILKSTVMTELHNDLEQALMETIPLSAQWIIKTALKTIEANSSVVVDEPSIANGGL